MHKPNLPVSLADLSAAGIRLRPYEAVTIVRELTLRVAHHEVAGVPSSHVIRLSSDGAISVEGPVGADGPSVARAAQLLDSLLPAAGAGTQFRVPGGLRLVLARASGALDLPPFDSLESFAEALTRFAATDPAGTVSNLVTAWVESVGVRAPESDPANTLSRSPLAQVEQFVAPRAADATPPNEVTVSDIRRARRATGLTLDYIAKQSDVPLMLLRQLEWGYFVNWPSGRSAEALLIRYARAAGLDEALVLGTIGPMLLEADQQRSALVPRQPDLPLRVDDPVVEVEVLPVPFEAIPREAIGSTRWTKALAALAIPALLVIALLPAWWASSSRDVDTALTPPAQTSRTEVSREAAPPETVPVARSGERRQVQSIESSAQSAQADDRSSSSLGRSAIPPSEATAGRQRVTEDQPDDSDANERSYRLASETNAETALSHVGTAMFYSPRSDDTTLSGVIPARGDGRDAVLRITRIVDDMSNNRHLRLAPDGRRIAFDSDRDGIRGVYVADRDGTNVRRVSADGFAAIPSWSPDGRTLAFVRADGLRADVWNLWTLNLDNGELVQITRHGAGQPRGASWFPDGNRLAYCYADRLIVRDLRSGADRVFTSPRRNRRLLSAAVSPDGRRIVFHIERDGAWLLELSDGSMRRVLDDSTAAEYTWSPDGRRFAYHSSKSDTWGIWVMAPSQ